MASGSRSKAGRVRLLVMVVTMIGFFSTIMIEEATPVASTVPGASSSSDIAAIEQGPATFSIIGQASGSDTILLASASPQASDSIEIHASSPLPVRLLLLDSYNGTLTVPAGTNITITINGNSFLLQPGVDAFTSSNPLITLNDGNNVIDYTIHTPGSAITGKYEFTIIIASFNNSNATFMNYSEGYPVTLNVQS
jgi:hypothetical protein